MNTDLTLIPCRANPDQWESEDPTDHINAKQGCDTACTIKATCRKILEQTITDYGYGPRVGPRGTWAGELYAEPQSDRRKKEAAA